MKKRFGTWDPMRIDDPQSNWMHPKNMMEDEEVCKAYGECHKTAEEWAREMGGKKFTTMGGEHSIMLKDDTVYDPVRFGGKKRPMKKEEYLEQTPFEFEESDF